MNIIKQIGLWISSKVLPIQNEGITEWEKVTEEGKLLRENIKKDAEQPEAPTDSENPPSAY